MDRQVTCTRHARRILFVGDAFMHQLALAAESHLGDYNMLQEETTEENSKGEQARFCNGSVVIKYLAGSSWNALAVDPSLARLIENDLIVANIAPGLSLSKGKWMLGATTRQMDIPPQLISLQGGYGAEAWREWVRVRRFGSMKHLCEIYRRHAAQFLRPPGAFPDWSAQRAHRPNTSACPTRDLEAGGPEGQSSNRSKPGPPLCRGAEYVQGRWKTWAMPSTLDKTLFGLAHQSVVCEGFQDMYEWVPSHCRLLEWDAREFCRQLGNRSVASV